MFINLSNHPSSKWSEKQLASASDYGEIMDIEFPSIDPLWTTTEVFSLAQVFVQKCISLIGSPTQKHAIHINGELMFCYYIIHQLLEYGYVVVVSASSRVVEEKSINTFEKKFEFSQFRIVEK